MEYCLMNKQQLMQEKQVVLKQYEDFKNKNINIDMSRGKPCKKQLDLSMEMLDCVNSKDTLILNNIDLRNYGVLDGIIDCKKLFADILEVSCEEIFVGGNSSLNLMYDLMLKALYFGVLDGEKPWGKQQNIKFLCVVPGYDRHFAITENFGFEMINIPMDKNGPDMDLIEKLVSEYDSIKGIWCVPKYSNPNGIIYSNQVIERFAKLKTKAKDFRIFWDNAYCVHDLYNENKILNLLNEAKKHNNQNKVYMFTSTSKITFSGSGVCCLATSKDNIDFLNKQTTIQIISNDKINQYRHIKFLKNVENLKNHMQKHAEILKPKFDMVLYTLDKNLNHLKICQYTKPQGGYFISFETMIGCGKRVVELCKNAGVTLTNAGATYPYGKDPNNSNIRIAPTLPEIDDLKIAMELFCICVKLSTLEKLIKYKKVLN